MATQRSLQVRLIVMALMCAAAVLVLQWKKKQRLAQPRQVHTPAPAPDLRQDWHRVEVTGQGKPGVFEIGLYRSPVPFRPVPLDRTRRDTPLETWISWKSHAAAGRDARDLALLAGHFVDPDYLPAFVRDRIKLPPEEYLPRLREAERNARAIGTARYGSTTLVIYRFDGSGRAADTTYHLAVPMVNNGGAWYIDPLAPQRDPVLMEAIHNDFGLGER